MKRNSIFYIIAAYIFIASCSHKQTKTAQSEDQDHLISLTHQQFETGNMSFGESQKMAFEELIKCNGNIVSKPAGTAKISTYVSGLVQRINCTTGQRVNAGQILFELTGNELIELQKEFAETASQLKRVRLEYERIKSLFSENVGSEKELIYAESEYKGANARYSALKMKIQFIGLDATKIEEGNFYESFSIKSPLNGTISQINVSLGQYADQQTNIAEILDVTQFHLKLAVFEKDLSKLNERQKIKFKLLGNNIIEYYATLNSIGQSVNSDSKTIMCFADIDDLKRANFVNNAYVEAQVIANKDTVNAVPEESIIKSEGTSYMLTLVKNENNIYFLKKTKVDVGRSINGYVEILNQPDFTKIITKGAYNIKVE